MKGLPVIINNSKAYRRTQSHVLSAHLPVSDELFADVGRFFCCLMWCVMEFPVIWRLAQPRRHDVRMETAGYEDTESLVCGFRFSHWRTIFNASAVCNAFESY